MLKIITLMTQRGFGPKHVPLISRHFSTSGCLATRQKEGGKWLHKLNDEEKSFTYGIRKGQKNVGYFFTLNSKHPITPEVMFQTLRHVERKFPPYQLTIRERNGELWFFKPDIPVNIDFEVLDKGTDTSQVHDNIMSPFDEVNGPLWRSRFIPADESDPCVFPEIREKFPFQYYYLESVSHVLLDGASQTLLYRSFMDIINSLQEGQPIDPSPIGEFIANDEYDRLYSECRQELEGNPEKMDAIKKSVLETYKQPLLFRAFPSPSSKEVKKTREIVQFIENNTLTKFFANCKDKKITVGNGFQTICMSALIELAQEAGVDEDTFDLSFSYSTDMRRYMTPREKPILGFHARKLCSLFTLRRNVRDDFWNNCKMVQQKNKELLGVSPIAQDIIQQKFLPYVSPEDFVKTEPVMTRDFSYNNVGNLKVGLKRREVVLTDGMDRFYIHHNIFPIYIQCMTFEGVYKTLMSYNSGVMTEETAFNLIEQIRTLIQYYSSQA